MGLRPIDDAMLYGWRQTNTTEKRHVYKPAASMYSDMRIVVKRRDETYTAWLTAMGHASTHVTASDEDTVLSAVRTWMKNNG